MLKPCVMCATEFEAKRLSAKYCGERCKKRAQRAGQTKTAKPTVPPPADQPKALEGGALVGEILPPRDDTEGVEAATRAELERADRLGTSTGQAALVLARRLDNPAMETGTAMSALARQHMATLAEAVKGAHVEVDPLDELRMRRERKLVGS